MPKCDIDIELDNDQKIYKVGEIIHGTVRVDVNADCECYALTISYRWRTSGKGEQDRGPKMEQTLFEGVWRPGRYSYMFKIEVPTGPLTYNGRYINVDWFLKAHADIPWALDPQSESKFVVKKGKLPTKIIMGSHTPSPDADKISNQDPEDGNSFRVISRPTEDAISEYFAYAQQFIRGVIMARSVQLLAVSVMIVFFLFVSSSEVLVLNGSILFILGIGLFSLVVIGILIRLFRVLFYKRMAETKIGEVIWHVDPIPVHARGTLACDVGFTAKRNLRILEATAELVRKEEVVQLRFFGTDQAKPKIKTYSYDFVEQKKDFPVSDFIRRGEKIQAAVEFVVPEDAPPSFPAKHNNLSWETIIRFKIPSWPDLVSRRRIVVIPTGY